MHRQLALAVAAFMFGSAVPFPIAQAQERSTVTLPLEIDLDTAQERITAETPQTFLTISRRQVCVPAQWAKWDYPCFRGIKMYRCEGKTKVSPQISCDINGTVRRSGSISIKGEGERIAVSVPVAASVTASKGSLRETASAAAVVTVNATPGVSPDWTPKLDIQPNYAWTTRPQLELFGLIKITFAGEVEPKLNEAIAAMTARVPTMLSELALREKVERAWVALQKPIMLAEEPRIEARFSPDAVGFSGLSVEGRKLRAIVSLSGETHVAVGTLGMAEPTPLPDLSEASGDGQFRLAIPIEVQFDEVERVLAAHFPMGIDVAVDQGMKGSLTFSDLRLNGTSDGRLRIRARVVAQSNGGLVPSFLTNWLRASGEVDIEAQPVLKSEGQKFGVEDLRISTDTDSAVVKLLSAAVGTEMFVGALEERLQYSYGRQLQRLKMQANAKLDRDVLDDVRLSGSLDTATIKGIKVSLDHFVIRALLEGALQAQLRF